MVRFYLGSSREEKNLRFEKVGHVQKRRRDRKPCQTLQMKRKIMGTLPHTALLWRPITVAIPRVLVPLGVCPPATGHRSIDPRSSSHRPIAQWTRRHHGSATDHHRSLATDHGSPATVQMGITQEISSQSMTGHRPSSLRSLDLENLNTGENLYSPATSQLATGQQTLYQPTSPRTQKKSTNYRDETTMRTPRNNWNTGAKENQQLDSGGPDQR